MKQSRSRSGSPARGERPGGDGLLSPAVQRALANKRAALAADAMLKISTPAGGAPAGALLQPSAPTPSGEPAEPLDGGVSLAGVGGSSPPNIPQQAIRGLLDAAASGSGGTQGAQVPLPLENGFAALGEVGTGGEDAGASSSSSPADASATMGLGATDAGGGGSVSYADALMGAAGTGAPPSESSTATAKKASPTRKSPRRETRRCVDCGTVQAASWHMTDHGLSCAMCVVNDARPPR